MFGHFFNISDLVKNIIIGAMHHAEHEPVSVGTGHKLAETIAHSRELRLPKQRTIYIRVHNIFPLERKRMAVLWLTPIMVISRTVVADQHLALLKRSNLSMILKA